MPVPRDKTANGQNMVKNTALGGYSLGSFDDWTGGSLLSTTACIQMDECLKNCRLRDNAFFQLSIESRLLHVIQVFVREEMTHPFVY